MRGVDFIYKSPGVNRPLLLNEDHPKDNLNKTYYRDQINKVANAIDGIIRRLRQADSRQQIKEGEENKVISVYRNMRTGKLKRSLSAKLRNRILVLFLIFTLSIFGRCPNLQNILYQESREEYCYHSIKGIRQRCDT